MKKLSLGKLKLASEEVLQRGQSAKIYGGSGEFSCSMLTCRPSHGCYQSNCRCEVTEPDGSGYCVDII